MMRLKMKTLEQTFIYPGSDEVLAGYPIPADGVLERLDLEVAIIGDGVGCSILQAAPYGLSVWGVTVEDPDTGGSLDSLWDQMIPKDVNFDSGSYDLDTVNPDSTPEMEIGTPRAVADIFGTLVGAKRLMSTQRLITAATSRFGFQPPSGETGFEAGKFQVVDTVSIHLSPGMRVTQPSYVLVGFSAPDTYQTTLTKPGQLSENKWARLKYLEYVLEEAYTHLIGLTEDVTPYEQAADLIKNLLEPAAVEDVNGAFKVQNWTTFTEGSAIVRVPGRIEPVMLSG